MCALPFLGVAMLAAVSAAPAWQEVGGQTPGLPKPFVLKDLPATGGVARLALSAKGELLAFNGGKGIIRFWDVQAQKLLPEMVVHSVDQKPRFADSLAFSPNGKLLASLNFREDGSLRVWNVASKKLVWQADALKHANQVAFAPDSNSVVVLEFSKARIYDAATGKVLHEMDIDPGFSSNLAFSPDGKVLVTAGRGAGQLRVWNYATAKQRGKVEGCGPVFSIAFTGDNRVLLISSWNRAIEAWDVSKNEKLRDLTAKIDGYGGWIHVCPDLGVFVIINDGKLTVYELGTGKSLLHEENVGHFGALAGDGKTLATMGPNETVKLWDLAAAIKNR
jgi:WD40 repeat protein